MMLDAIRRGRQNDFLPSKLEEPVESHTQNNGPDYKREYNLVDAEFQINAFVSGL